MECQGDPRPPGEEGIRLVEYSDLLGAGIEVRNDKGEVIFAMKRKDTWGPTYYLFEKHEDRAGTEEDKAKLNRAVAGIAAMSRMAGFPLYDIKEVNEALSSRMDAVMKSEGGKAAQKLVDGGGGEQLESGMRRVFIKDVSFNVFDHATGKINELTVGISAAAKGSLESLGLGKDVGTDNGQEDNQEAQ